MAAAAVTDEQIVDMIIDYIKNHGYPPTIREIGAACGLKSTSSVNSRLKKLFKKGLLETDAENAPRAIRVPGYIFIPVGDAEPAAGV